VWLLPSVLHDRMQEGRLQPSRQYSVVLRLNKQAKPRVWRRAASSWDSGCCAFASCSPSGAWGRHAIAPNACAPQRHPRSLSPVTAPRRTGVADAARTSAVALPDGLPYQIGTLTNTLHIWVDPVSGVDAGRTGTVASQPLKTLKAAWSKARLHPSTRILIIPLLLVVPWIGAEVPCCAAGA
jgi:hypothetical protein